MKKKNQLIELFNKEPNNSEILLFELICDIRDQLEQIQKALWAIRAIETVAVNKIK